MLKWLVTLTVVIFATVAVPANNQVSGKRTAGQSQQSAQQPSTPAVAPVTTNQATTYYQRESTPKPEGWHKLITWPEGITAWLIMLTLGAIVWQAWETRKAAEATRDAAKAALLQANHTVTSERAWLIAEAGDAGIPPEIEGATGIRWTEFSVRFVNKGKTPAFLLEAGYCGKVLPHGETLPTIQPPFEEKEISKWEDKGLPLLPGADVRKNHLGTWANDPVKIKRGFDVLWVYGYIKYSDAFGSVRETWYCYRWVHEIERYQASEFIAGGPESYNRAT
jgi:hypothetical protein